MGKLVTRLKLKETLVYTLLIAAHSDALEVIR